MYAETLSKDTRTILEKIVSVVAPFYLAGGTALALQFGHRISEDQSESTFNGMLDGVKISFFHYPYPLIFKRKDFMSVFLADERDIGAMKVQAISDRGNKKDFVDLFVLLKKYSIEELLGFFNKKYEKFNYNQLHILKSLSYFYNADENPEPIYIHPIAWTEVKKVIKNKVDEYIKSQS